MMEYALNFYSINLKFIKYFCFDNFIYNLNVKKKKKIFNEL